MFWAKSCFVITIGFGTALFVNTTQPLLPNMFCNNIKIVHYDYENLIPPVIYIMIYSFYTKWGNIA